MMVCLDPNGVYVELMESTVNDGVAGRGGPLRRVTIPVPPGTCDAAVSFYTDLMGLKPLIDRELSGTPQTSVLSSSLGIGDFRLRIVSLQQGDVDHGMVGLMEYFEPKLKVEALGRAANEPFQATFVFLTDDIQAVQARAQALGAPIVCPPLAVDIPQRGQALEMTCLDPNGVLLAFTQFQES
jgi:predicted enzyme related to lactoylglutathione lyase